LVANGPGSLDVIEMDAATHGLVDDARDLRDKALFAPVQSRYKIYIIDEAHQLGPAAANALLKIVEEPPPYVIFIFATTEPEKVISTIRSRTHHYQFHLVSNQVLSQHCQQVLSAEGVKLTDEIINLAVNAGSGSVRDTLSALGQFIAGSSDGKLDYERAAQLLGHTGSSELGEIFSALAASDLASLITAVERVLQRGLDTRRFVQDILERVRDMTVALATSKGAIKTLRSYSEDELVNLEREAQAVGIQQLLFWSETLADHLIKLRSALPAQLILEMMFARMINARPALSLEEPSPKSRLDARPLPKVVESQPKAHKEVPAPMEQEKGALAAANSLKDIEQKWIAILETVKNRRRLIWTLLVGGSSLTDFSEGILTISFSNQGAMESFSRSAGEELVLSCITDVLSEVRQVKVRYGQASETIQSDEEDVSDSVEELTGANLLMRELGATVISKDEV
jgi:DNA polymerase-3 subunit gamma/tau